MVQAGAYAALKSNFLKLNRIINISFEKNIRQHYFVFNIKYILFDNEGRRLGIERRQFLYNVHIPERRSGKDRRSECDRRQKTRISEE